MQVTSTQKITVFGGTGFLGRRVIRHLRDAGFTVRIATRHPDRARALFPDASDGIESIFADVNDDASTSHALQGAWGTVNAVSLYVERGRETFHSVHVEAAGRVARIAQESGVARLAHVSGIGADSQSPSPYIRSRGEGEAAVVRAFPHATIIRSAVMFGPGDAFVTPILRMFRYLPAFPLFGRGQTKLQPAYVDDVGEAIAQVLRTPSVRAVYELGGPRIYTYKALLETLARCMGRTPLLVPLPFALWRALGYVAEILPHPPITRNQIELMRIDNVVTSGAAGFGALGISPRPIEDVIPEVLRTRT